MADNFKDKLPKLQPGEYREVTVMHDNWCAFLTSKGGDVCDCDPDIIRGRHPNKEFTTFDITWPTKQ